MNLTRRIRSAVVLAIVAALGLAAGLLYVRAQRADEPAPRADRYTRLLPSLCSMRDAVDGGGIERARALFWNTAHETLHVLAADLADRGDRGRSAALLRAKAAIELTVAAPASGEAGALRAQVDTLIEASSSGLALVSPADVITCPDPDGGASP